MRKFLEDVAAFILLVVVIGTLVDMWEEPW